MCFDKSSSIFYFIIRLNIIFRKDFQDCRGDSPLNFIFTNMNRVIQEQGNRDNKIIKVSAPLLLCVEKTLNYLYTEKY